MTPATAPEQGVVPPEEVARRIAEWRRLSYEHRGPAVIVYGPAQHACPWPACPRRIRGIDFRLDGLGTPAQVEKWLAAWWQGDGLVGCCPTCKNYVRYGYFGKLGIQDPTQNTDALLPDDWWKTAVVAPRTDE